MHARIVEFGQHFLPDLAIQNLAGVIEAVEQERHVEHTRFRNEIRERASRDDGHLDRAELHTFDHLAFASKS